MTGVAKNTVVKLLVHLEAACAMFSDEAIRNVNTDGCPCAGSRA